MNTTSLTCFQDWSKQGHEWHPRTRMERVRLAESTHIFVGINKQRVGTVGCLPTSPLDHDCDPDPEPCGATVASRASLYFSHCSQGNGSFASCCYNQTPP